MDLTIEELAMRQIADYRGLKPGTFFGERREPLTLEEAYRVQAEVSRLRVDEGDKVAGYKVGCTSAEIERLFGLRGPIYAVLFASELRQSGDRVDASAFANLAIEGEMAARTVRRWRDCRGVPGDRAAQSRLPQQSEDAPQNSS